MNNVAESSLANNGAAVSPDAFIKAILIFAATFAVYFLSRSPGLDDFDSVNFAMGVRSFNLWNHQPHPPGYPVFIFAGWIFAKIFGLTPEVSLYLVSSLGAALFIAAWFLIIRAQFEESLAWWIAASLTITPVVWMTATKVLSDAPAAGFLSAEIFAAIVFASHRSRVALLAVSLFGAAAAGIRPQLFLVVATILVVALRKGRASGQMSIFGAAVFLAGCFAWLGPTWYLQSRLYPEVPAWLAYPQLVYGQWQWRLDKPNTYVGAGNWTPSYLGLRFAEHFLGWFGLGFGFLRSPVVLIVGTTIVITGIVAYLLRPRDPHDRQFWNFHKAWSLLHAVTIFLFLGGKQRYYLVIFPLLLVALLRGLSRLPPHWNRLALTLPALLLYITIPLAIENHREEAPPVRLVHYLEKLYEPSQRQNVVLLFTNAGRHSEWYTPEFKTIRAVPPVSKLSTIFEGASAIYTDDPKVPLPEGWGRRALATFERSIIIHTKHHSLTLFSIDRL